MSEQVKKEKSFKLRNTSKKVFTDISNEVERTYVYDKDRVVVIDEPVHLCDEEDAHIIVDVDQIRHTVKPDWLSIRVSVKEGLPHVQ